MFRLRQMICETARRLSERGFIAATEGNLSCRLDDGRILCTPAGVEKGALQPGDLVLAHADGRPCGHVAPTSEISMHARIYEMAPAIAAIVHCHPPHATALAMTAGDLPRGLLAEVETFLGDIPKVPFRMPGSTALADAVAVHAGRARCALLANHGAVSWDADLLRARWWMEMLDAYCRTVLLARAGGTLAPLSADDVVALRRAGGLLP